MSNKQYEENYNDFESGFTMLILAVIACICIFIPTLRVLDNSYYSEKIPNVKATVIDKEYRENDSYYLIGTTIGIDQEYEYLLTFRYNDVSTIIQNQTLYNALDIGSTINVDLYIYYDKNGNATSKELVTKQY